MKTKCLIAFILLLLGVVLFTARAGEEEQVTTKRVVTVRSTSAAIKATKTYMDQGATWIVIGHPLRMFSKEDPEVWEVEGNFKH